MVTDKKPEPPSSGPWLAPWLPNWANAVFNAGIVSTDPAVRRRQRFTNVTSYALALDAITHLVFNCLYDFAALLPINVYNFAMAGFYLLLPRLHRVGANFVVNTLIAVSLVGHAYVVFAFGRGSNLHVYFTLAGVILFMVGVRQWRNFLVLYAMAATALIVVMTSASDEGFLIGWDHDLRESLAFQAMLSTMVMNAAVIAYFLFTLDRAETRLRQEYDRSELLLHNVLPPNIARRLKDEPDRRIADHLDGVPVLFTDLVGFTPAAAAATPDSVVRYLHRLFSRFDILCDTHDVDKIKTIGDSYMAVGGLRGDGGTGVRRIGNLALDMLRIAGEERLAGNPLAIRIGIHCGPVIAGVIGDRRMTYDVWGDTVNFASRLESHGMPGRIQVSDAYRIAARDSFAFEPRGRIDFKGFGERETFFLVGPRPA